MITFDVYVLNLFMCAQTQAIIAQMLIFVYTLCVSVDVLFDILFYLHNPLCTYILYIHPLIHL